MSSAEIMIMVLLRQGYEFCLDNDNGFCLEKDTSCCLDSDLSFAEKMLMDFAYQVI